jgi:hypothetical protein
MHRRFVFFFRWLIYVSTLCDPWAVNSKPDNFVIKIAVCIYWCRGWGFLPVSKKALLVQQCVCSPCAFSLSIARQFVAPSMLWSHGEWNVITMRMSICLQAWTPWFGSETSGVYAPLGDWVIEHCLGASMAMPISCLHGLVNEIWTSTIHVGVPMGPINRHLGVQSSQYLAVWWCRLGALEAAHLVASMWWCSMNTASRDPTPSENSSYNIYWLFSQ